VWARIPLRRRRSRRACRDGAPPLGNRIKGHRPRNLEPPSMTIPAIVAILVFLAAFLVLNRIEFGRFD
jgi:ribose/xylose/arabinose/galactoside ABC-type transport system permease subunit